VEVCTFTSYSIGVSSCPYLPAGPKTSLPPQGRLGCARWLGRVEIDHTSLGLRVDNRAATFLVRRTRCRAPDVISVPVSGMPVAFGR
jgi:hypothetical protein